MMEKVSLVRSGHGVNKLAGQVHLPKGQETIRAERKTALIISKDSEPPPTVARMKVGKRSPAVAATVATIRMTIPAAVAATVATAVTMALRAVAVMGQKHNSHKHHRLSPNDLNQGRSHLSTKDLLQRRGLHRLIRRPGQNSLLQCA